MHRLLRTLVVLFMALTQMYLAVKFDFSGAGVLSSIMLGVLVKCAWLFNIQTNANACIQANANAFNVPESKSHSGPQTPQP